MNKSKIDALQAAIGLTKGRFFTVTFIKKDKTERTMNCRIGVKKHLKGGESTTKHLDHLITVYEPSTKSYKNVNLNTVTEFNFDNINLSFKAA